MALRRSGTLSPTLHSILQNMHTPNRLRLGAVEDAEVVGGEGELQAAWVSVEARIQKAT
jgi:hypothetical protein